MEAISKRIKEFFNYKGFRSDTEAAASLGYDKPEKISRLFRKDSTAKPSADILEDITNMFVDELNAEWLLSGRGEMLKTKTPGHKDQEFQNKYINSLERIIEKQEALIESLTRRLTAVETSISEVKQNQLVAYSVQFAFQEHWVQSLIDGEDNQEAALETIGKIRVRLTA